MTEVSEIRVQSSEQSPTDVKITPNKLRATAREIEGKKDRDTEFLSQKVPFYKQVLNIIDHQVESEGTHQEEADTLKAILLAGLNGSTRKILEETSLDDLSYEEIQATAENIGQRNRGKEKFASRVRRYSQLFQQMRQDEKAGLRTNNETLDETAKVLAAVDTRMRRKLETVSDRQPTYENITARTDAIEEMYSHDYIYNRRIAYYWDVQRLMEDEVQRGRISRHDAQRQIAQLMFELESGSTVDSLTGLLNFKGIEMRLQKETDMAKRTRKPLQICLVDLDRFKSINDTYGHLTGNEVLKAVAKYLGGSIRSTDEIGRWGGEELLMILPDMPHETACERAEAIRENFQSTVEAALREVTPPLNINFGDTPITASFGIAEVRDGDLRSAFERADEAVYAAKEGGRNLVVGEGGIITPRDASTTED